MHPISARTEGLVDYGAFDVPVDWRDSWSVWLDLHTGEGGITPLAR